jgi:hypothetical protein
LLSIFLLLTGSVSGASAEEVDFAAPEEVYWRLTHFRGVSDVSNVILLTGSSMLEFSHPCFLFGLVVLQTGGTIQIPEEGIGWSNRRGEECHEAGSSAITGIERSVPLIRFSSLTGQELRFLDGENQTIATFVRFEPKGFEVRMWQIVEYSDGKKLIPAERLAWVRFIQGQIDGTPGCSRGFFGTYNLVGDQLNISDISYLVTGFCSPGYETQNDLVMKAMREDVLIVELNGSYATLLDKSGAKRMILKLLPG